MIRLTQLQEQVYNYLKNKILNNELEDDVIYSETKMADEIGVSRTPVRDALQCLSQEGFIDILPSKGFQLRRISEDIVIKNGQVRSALETYSAVMLVRRRHAKEAQQVVEGLEQLLEEQEEIYRTSKSISEFSKCDWKFHEDIILFVGNDEMTNIFHSHFYYTHKLARKSLERTGRMRETIQEHRKIVSMIKKGDEKETYDAVMLHMDHTRDLNLAFLPKKSVLGL